MTVPLFGLYPQSDFRVTDGHCRDCPTLRQALWYFGAETIAVPKPGIPVAAFTRGVDVGTDLRTWLASRVGSPPPGYPQLIWIAAPQVFGGARLAADTTFVENAEARLRFELTPKMALNRSYFDASSARFFRERSIKIRGAIDGERIVARTLWPEDFRLDRAAPASRLDSNVPASLALRALVRSDPRGGARSPFGVWMLWRRDGVADPLAAGSAALGIMLNGAQGDDDEAHGGHFALVTGSVQENGAIGDWLTNNFYSLDTVSEKGIIAAPVPLDNYLGDLNSGQNWYRPTHMLVAVLRDARAPSLLQGAFNRVYNQFWRHQLVYRHATMNCASISVDVLRWIGWDIPVRGSAGRLAAVLGFPWFVVKERSIAKACTAFDYLWEDQTRLLPAAAFEEIGASLLGLAMAATAAPAQGPPAATLGQMVAEDVDAILFLRLPQFPSSRAFGDSAVVTPREFRARLPKVPQVVPVPDRSFPDALRDGDLLPPPRPPSSYAAAIWGTLLVVGIPIWLYRLWKRRRARSAS
ncbi:MAG TPA: hypothetical protein VMU96_00655 [Casimicrobiaceae bacterium]|nr:hypothetical protein [Casimicrobiaceae bacterium]